MLERFKGIEPGARVRYKTPQGTEHSGRACRLLIFAEHVVVDIGNGRPVVVDGSNYVSHRNRRARNE